MPTITVQIGASDEDAHQSGGSGTVDPTGNVLNASATNQWVGLSFNAAGLVDIQDTTITSAYLELYFTSGSLDDPDVTIYGYSDPGQWGAFVGTNNEISGLSSTSATVTWTASGVGTGWKSSPDIKTVIQEIADMSDWIGNSICIVYKGRTGSSAMRVQSYDGSSSLAPKLVINYVGAPQGIAPSAGIAGAESFGSSAFVPGAVTVAPSAGIASAQSVPTAALAMGAAVVSPDGMATAESVPTLTVTTGAAVVSPDGMPTAESVPGPVLFMPDGSLLPDSIGSGEAIGALIIVPGVATVAPDGVVSGENVNGGTVTGGVVDVAPSGIGTAESVAEPIISDRRLVSTLASGSADGFEASDGTMSLTTTSGNVTAATPWVAFLFTDPALPSGATIVDARLRLFMQTYDDPNLTIKAQKSISPAALTTTSGDISGRMRTDNGVTWNAANVGTNQYVNSPNLAVVIQEVINLSGWTAGTSDILIILQDNGGGGHIRFNMADAGSDRPQLVVDYTVGDTTQTITVPGVPTGESIDNPVLTTGETVITVDEAAGTGESVPSPDLITPQILTYVGDIPSGWWSVDATVTEGDPVITVDDGMATGESLGEPLVGSGVSIEVAAGIATAEAAGEPVVAVGLYLITPDSIDGAESIGAPLLTTAVWIVPDSVPGGESHGAAVLSAGMVEVAPTGIPGGEALGASVVSAGEWHILTDGVPTAESMGAAGVAPDVVYITPDGMATAESVGAAVLSAIYGVTVADGVGSLENVGTADVTPGAVLILPDGMATGESMGTPDLSAIVQILAGSVDTAESVGAVAVTPGGVVILPDGMPGVEAIGAAVLSPGPIDVTVDSMASGAAFGVAAMEVGAVVIAPESIAAGELFGILVMMSRFLPTVNIWRMPGKGRVYLVWPKERVYRKASVRRVGIWD